MKTPNTSRDFAKVLGITATFVLLTLLGFEIYLRHARSQIVQKNTDYFQSLTFIRSNPDYLIRRTDLGRRLIPGAKAIIKNHKLSNRDIPMDINKFGFRGPDIALKKEPNSTRILVLGDSITWGDYLLEEETYVRRLEFHLRVDHPEHPFEVINGGVGDIGLREELAILKEQGLQMSPDIVVVGFYLNDSRPPWGFEGELGSQGWLRSHSLLADTVYSKLKLMKWLSDVGESRFKWISAMKDLNWMHDPSQMIELTRLARYDWGAAWDSNSWQPVMDQFKELKRLAQKHSFKVAVVIFPVAMQVHADFLEDTPQRTLLKHCSDLEFQCLDLLPLLREHRSEDLYYDQCHPKPAANDLIGKTIARFLN